MRGIVMRDHMGLTPADHEREEQARKLMEYKRNLPRVMICPQTRVRCECPASCDPPYDCMSAELGYIKEAQIARVQSLRYRREWWERLWRNVARWAVAIAAYAYMLAILGLFASGLVLAFGLVFSRGHVPL